SSSISSTTGRSLKVCFQSFSLDNSIESTSLPFANNLIVTLSCFLPFHTFSTSTFVFPGSTDVHSIVFVMVNPSSTLPLTSVTYPSTFTSSTVYLYPSPFLSVRSKLVKLCAQSFSLVILFASIFLSIHFLSTSLSVFLLTLVFSSSLLISLLSLSNSISITSSNNT